MKKLLLILCIGILLMGCNRQQQKTENVFFKGKDSYQREVVLQNEPLRVVSFSQAVTEAIFLLHAEDKLVGISQFCDYPPETQNIPKVGDLININVENVLKQRPDLVIVGSIVSDKTVKQFEKANIPVYCLKEEQRIDDLPRLIRTVGKLLNRTEAADQLAQNYHHKINQYKSNAPKSQKSVYYVVGFGATGDYTVPGNTFIHDIITLAGGRNIGESLTTWSVSREYLFQQDPDCIFIREEDYNSFCHTAPYNQLRAVKEGHAYPIPSSSIDNLCPRNFQVIDTMAERLQELAE